MRPVSLATPAVLGNLTGVPSAIGSHSTSGSALKAVFLSYASEDAEAARRLCEALRANGIEVWFDEAELQGGENWEAQIKKRIHECTLFMPIVSVQTQSRLEGYFRREWDLASERTHDMAATVPFLVPVAIDETSETNAEVPDEFLRAHWMRLPRALPTPEFLGQIERLLQSLPPGRRGRACRQPGLRRARRGGRGPRSPRSLPSGPGPWSCGKGPRRRRPPPAIDPSPCSRSKT